MPNIKVIENCHVLGLLTTPDQTHIVGVSLIHHRSDGSFESALNADLVVDATGRRSQSSVWLEKLGYEKPQEEQIRVGIGYMTRIYRRRPEHLQGDLATIVSPSLPNWRYGVILAQEGDDSDPAPALAKLNEVIALAAKYRVWSRYGRRSTKTGARRSTI
ncbi:hypothetical protein [Nostoc sp. CHAB 5715]|uniref:hypothetical protein n=1 Tax=Nostoc sp. CHAB 5715 TaxID=2780400 RepID=UPI001E2B64DD|nr:hypothetical protein [Nostoc sp. CHAB 5715]MCC5625619.1 hypothetical protein [Nostoc sp. CHAB 5715]